ncbi:hypothetical protein FOXYSP1_20171 [Fusarium oxysporum f. sp. phaseoli]
MTPPTPSPMTRQTTTSSWVPVPASRALQLSTRSRHVSLPAHSASLSSISPPTSPSRPGWRSIQPSTQSRQFYGS